MPKVVLEPRADTLDTASSSSSESSFTEEDDEKVCPDVFPFPDPIESFRCLELAEVVRLDTRVED